MLGEHEVAGSNPVIPIPFKRLNDAQVLELADNRPRDGRAREGVWVRILPVHFDEDRETAAQVVKLVDTRA